MKWIKNLMEEKQEEMIALMVLTDIKFMKANWFENLDAMFIAWYKISHKFESKKTKDWYEVTGIPYLEKIEDSRMPHEEPIEKIQSYNP